MASALKPEDEGAGVVEDPEVDPDVLWVEPREAVLAPPRPAGAEDVAPRAAPRPAGAVAVVEAAPRAARVGAAELLVEVVWLAVVEPVAEVV
jgi:hypothetical protein